VLAHTAAGNKFCDISGYLKSSWANIRKSNTNTGLFWSSVNS